MSTSNHKSKKSQRGHAGTTAESSAPQAEAQRYEPYKPTKTRARKKPRTALSKYLATPPPRPSPQWPPPMNEEPDENAPTLREVSLGLVRKLYPSITLRDDFDVAALAAGTYRGEPSNEAAYKWLDAILRCEESTWPPECKTLEQGRAVMVSRLKISLDRRVQITGLKPWPGQRNVFVRPIPDSEYSIRLWPGATASREYCLDFVHSATGEATNSPFEYEIWSLPDPDALFSLPPMRLNSLENGFGVNTPDIRPGEEKFVLKEGLTCMLTRPGKRGLRFTVPVRRRESSPAQADDFDVLDLPKIVD